MAKKKPLDLEKFFFSRNEIAQKHNDRLEMQAMTRVRKYMADAASNQKEDKTAKADKKSQSSTKQDDKTDKQN